MIDWSRVVAKLQTYTTGQSIRGDAIRIYGLQIVIMALGIVSSAIVARTLGPSEKGVVDLYRLLGASLVDIGLLGVNSGLLYYRANQQVALPAIHGSALLFALVAGGLMVGGGYVGLPFLQGIFVDLPAWMILIAMSLAPFTFYTAIANNILTGINQAVASYQISAGFGVINTVAVALLWWGNWLTADSLVEILSIFAVLNALLLFGILYRHSARLSPDLPLLQKSLRYGFVVYIGFLANMLHFKIDQLMISRWLGTRELGIYALSVRWAEMLFVLDNAIIAAALYRISASSAQAAFSLTGRVLRTQLLISVGVGAGLALGAYPLIILLYGVEYQEAVIPLILLIPGIIAWSSAKIMSQYISYNRGQQWWPTLFAVMGMLLNVGLNFLLIPWLQMRGASIASSLSYSFVMLATWFAFLRVQKTA